MLHWVQTHQLALVAAACSIGAVFGFREGLRLAGRDGLLGKACGGLIFGLAYAWMPAAAVTIVVLGFKAIGH